MLDWLVAATRRVTGAFTEDLACCDFAFQVNNMLSKAPCYSLGALKACTLPLSTPANGSMATLMSAGRRAENVMRQAAASSAALLTWKASPPKASMMASYLHVTVVLLLLETLLNTAGSFLQWLHATRG